MKPVSPVAIAGIGCICSAGLTLEESMRFLYKGERHPAPPANFSVNYPFVFPVFEILDDFFPADKINKTNVLRMPWKLHYGDVEAARQQYNRLGRPKGKNNPPPDQLWATRHRVTNSERVTFRATMSSLRQDLQATEEKHHGRALDGSARATLERFSVSTALRGLGYLSIRRKRISPAIKVRGLL